MNNEDHIRYKQADLSALILKKYPPAMIFERNVIPCLIENMSGKHIKCGDSVVPPGGFMAVQPDGELHPTTPHLHNLNGEWQGKKFINISEYFTQKVALSTSAIVTKEDDIFNARYTILKQNPGLNIEDLQAFYGPSISRIAVYKIHPDLDGAELVHNGYTMKLDSTKALCVVTGKGGPDVYVNSIDPLEHWYVEGKLGQKEFSAKALMDQAPLLSRKDLAKAEEKTPLPDTIMHSLIELFKSLKHAAPHPMDGGRWGG